MFRVQCPMRLFFFLRLCFMRGENRNGEGWMGRTCYVHLAYWEFRSKFEIFGIVNQSREYYVMDHLPVFSS